jgi:hypothetical protein
MYLKEFEIFCDMLEQKSKIIDEFYTRHCEEATKNAQMKKICISFKQKHEQKIKTR